MQSSKLQSDMLPDTRRRTLALLFGPGTVDAAICPSPDEGSDNRVVYRHFDAQPDAPDPLRGIEDIIYDNPLLLSEYARTVCMAADVPRLLVPPVLGRIQRRRLFSREWPQAATPVTLDCGGCSNALLLADMTGDLCAFVRRTFSAPELTHPLAAGIAAACDRPGPHVTAAMYGDGIDVIATDGPKLLSANRYTAKTPSDAVYYTLAVMQTAGLDMAATDVALHGLDGDSLRETASLLAKWLRRLSVAPDQLPYPLQTVWMQVLNPNMRQ